MKLIGLTIVLALIGTTVPASAQAAITRFQVEITRQSLDGALKDFATQTGLQVARFTDTAGSAPMVGPLNGHLTVEEALGQLLAGSGFTYKVVNEKTVAVVNTENQSSGSTGFPGLPIPTADISHAGSSGRLESIHIAQGDAAQSTQDQSATANPNDQNDQRPGAKPDPAKFEEVTVTGTHIRGAGPAGSRVEVMDREEIEKTGLATTQQVIQSLPQNFGAGPNEDTTATGSLEARAFLNQSFGSGINLRGLGADSTLTLINGRRIASSGRASFVDVSTIPTSAIERIEVLTDGASALYGSDAIGGVVNIVLRDDYEGAEARARYGIVTNGNEGEYQLGAVFGTDWNTGRGLVTYEYYKRENLPAAEREFVTQDLRPFGGDDLREAANPGTIVRDGESFAIPAGQDGTNLTIDDLIPGAINLEDRRSSTDVLPEQERHAAYVNLSQEITQRLSVFAEGRYAERRHEHRFQPLIRTLQVPLSNPFFIDPFGGSSSVDVQYSMVDDLGPLFSSGRMRSGSVTSGANLEFAHTWATQIFGSYSREKDQSRVDNFINDTALTAALADPNPATAFNPFGDGSHTNPQTIESIRAFIKTTQTSEVWLVNVKADGTLATLPGGDLKVAIGAEYRDESLKVDVFDQTRPVPGFTEPEFGNRDVEAAFAELRIPVFGENSAQLGLKNLDLSVAGRLERYSDFGTTTDPRFGLSWSPLQSLTVRGTYGTSFRAPLLTELNEFNRAIFDFVIPDPQSPSGEATVLFLFGNNKDLEPEEATTWTAGVDYAPLAMPDLKLSLSYFNLEVKGKIREAFNDAFVILIEENRFAPLITRNPDLATVAALMNDPDFSPIFGVSPEDVDAIVDLRLRNIGVIETDGADFTAYYGFDTDSSRFDIRLHGSYFFKFEEAQTPASPLIGLLNTVRNPVDWRMRNSVTWRYGGISATAFVNYTDSYRDDESDPERRIGSWTTVDLSLAYSVGDRPASRWLDRIVASLSIQNAADTDPPFVNNRLGIGFDPENAEPLGRYIAFQITKTW